MKKDLDIILSLTAIAGVVILAILWCCRSMSLTAISLDTFIGVIATMIGLLVTFAIGWQIVNALEIKERLKEIETIKATVNKQQKLISELAWDTKSESMYILAEECSYRKDHLNSFRFALSAFLFCLMSESSNNIDAILLRLEQTAKHINQGSNISKKNYQAIIRTDQAIRDSPKFPFIKFRYEELFIQYIQKVSCDE